MKLILSILALCAFTGCESFRIEGQLEYAGKTVSLGRGIDGKTVLGLRANLNPQRK